MFSNFVAHLYPFCGHEQTFVTDISPGILALLELDLETKTTSVTDVDEGTNQKDVHVQ